MSVTARRRPRHGSKAFITGTSAVRAGLVVDLLILSGSRRNLLVFARFVRLILKGEAAEQANSDARRNDGEMG
jgi:hypothetical protein